MHALTKYRRDKELTLEKFANLIKASKSMVWKWENGEAEPRPVYRQRIEIVTDGEVTQADLLLPLSKVEAAE